MSNDPENLGRPVAWQIREVPETIRDAVTEQARVEGVKVGELLTRLVLDAQAAGWSFAASTRFANPSNNDPSGLASAERVAAKITDMAAAGLPVSKRHVTKVASALVAQLPPVMRLARPSKPALTDESD